MADEFGRSGVRVNAMQAGSTETPSRFTRGTKFPVGQALTGRFERLKGYFFRPSCCESTLSVVYDGRFSRSATRVWTRGVFPGNGLNDGGSLPNFAA
jgi:hypothetical protein